MSFKEYSQLENDNTEIIHKTDKTILYLNKYFTLNDNSVIFSNTYLVTELFTILKNRNSDIAGLKLISHQADHKIDKKIFNQKPINITKWFGINIEHEDKNLVPLPLGISNTYSPKNLRLEDFKKYINSKKTIFAYSNFQVNTNYFERVKIRDQIQNKSFITTQNPELAIQSYAEKLSKSKFVICPPGNGVDTHRFWESLYFNSIPIALKHLTLTTAKDIPVLFIDSFDTISEEKCNIYLNNLENEKINYESLTMDYWLEKINYEKKIGQSQIEVNLSIQEIQSIKERFHRTLKREMVYKNFYTFRRKIHSKVN